MLLLKGQFVFICNIYYQCPVPEPIGVDLLQSSGKTSVQITVIPTLPAKHRD